MPQVTRITIQLEDFIDDIIKQVTLNTTANLVETTPVDTGWARANWVPHIGSPFDGTDGSTDRVSNAAQEQGIAQVITQYQFPRTIFISNNVPYINRLNEGSSSQAPRGFVQNAIASAIREVS